MSISTMNPQSIHSSLSYSTIAMERQNIDCCGSFEIKFQLYIGRAQMNKIAYRWFNAFIHLPKQK